MFGNNMHDNNMFGNNMHGNNMFGNNMHDNNMFDNEQVCKNKKAQRDLVAVLIFKINAT
jgi:hypothetical protein